MIDRRMDRALFKKMKDAGCDWLYFGVESGSDRVLEAMNKKHRAADTLSVLRAAKESGIKAQANFMFGYPAERKEDHELTLRHLEKIRPYIESILASQSFCTLEKKTVMSERFADFGIADGSHHLYWSSLDGRNNYMERFRRYEEFCRLAIELGFPEGSGVFYEKPDKGILIGDYHMYKGEFAEAAVAYRRFMEKYGAKPDILRKEAAAYEMSGDKDKALKVYSDALDMYRDSSVTTSGIETLKKKIEELK